MYWCLVIPIIAFWGLSIYFVDVFPFVAAVSRIDVQGAAGSRERVEGLRFPDASRPPLRLQSGEGDRAWCIRCDEHDGHEIDMMDMTDSYVIRDTWCGRHDGHEIDAMDMIDCM